LNFNASLNISSELWTKIALIPTVAGEVVSGKYCLRETGLRLTNAGTCAPSILAPGVGTTLRSGEATPGLMRRDSLMTAVCYLVSHYSILTVEMRTKKGSFSRSWKHGTFSRFGQCS
jgi:hypothetical protein